MADMSSVASFPSNDGGILPITRSAGGYQNYDMDDRVEYQPSMAKVTDFSSFASIEGASPATPDKDKKKNRKNFRVRMNCKNPGSKLKARYWACKDW